MNRPDRKHAPVTLVILPFENLSTEHLPESEIFCTSFCLDLITELSRFRQFQIISYDSVRKVRPDSKAADELPEALNTDFFVRGSYRRHGDQIRINIRLTDTHSHHLIWADRFKGHSEELFELQESILLELVSTLQGRLNYNLLTEIRKKPKTSLKAYECWLYGMEELKKGTAESDEKAREYFRRAISLDPSYSLAYSGMSLTYFNEWSCQLWDRWELSRNGAFEWAQKAIELDDRNYVAAYVLGRVYLYQHSFASAEHYLRKSLRLNGNDPDSLIQIALCFVYLGYPDEAFRLYEKTLRLNPAGTEAYVPVGVVILFELGKTREAVSLAERVRNIPYVDFNAYCAAAWYYLGDEDKMQVCLNDFLRCYSDVINHGEKADLQEAVEWMSRINPFKSESRLAPFRKYISGTEFHVSASHPSFSLSDNINRIVDSGDFWAFTFEGKTVRLASLKGFVDLRQLVQNPGTPVHCTELMGIPVLSDGQRVLDEQARAEYREKIVSLQNEIAEAETLGDFGRSEEIREEYEQLVEHLSRSLGLRGNVRRAGNSVEKARSAVTWRIRNAIAKIEEVHPSLGKHFSNSIKTGTFCSYEPEKEWFWEYGRTEVPEPEAG